MKRVIMGSLVGVAMLAATPAILPILAQRSYAQTSSSQAEQFRQLIDLGSQQMNLGQNVEAIETFKQALAIAKVIRDKKGEAMANIGMGLNYHRIGNFQEALISFEQSLRLFRELNDRWWEATTLGNLGKVNSDINQPQDALKHYQQALSIFREVSDRKGEASTLNSIGAIYSNIGQHQEALKYCQQALTITREVQDRSGEAITLNSIGAIYGDIGQFQEGLTYLQEALSVFRKVDDRLGEATTLSNIGGVYDSIGRSQEALTYYQQALLIRREISDRRGEATTLNGIGLVYSNLGEFQEALSYFQQALPIAREVEDRSEEADTLNGIGAVYSKRGQVQEALKYHQQALTITREVEDRSGEADTLNGIGLVYSNLGEFQEALTYFQQTLLISQETSDRVGEVTTLNSIGLVYTEIGQYQEALTYHEQALDIAKEVGNRRGEAAALINIGVVYINLSKPQEALNYHQQALLIIQEVGDRWAEAATLNNIGEICINIGKNYEALKYLQESLRMQKQLGDRSGESVTLNNIGTVYYNMEQHQEALTYLQQTLAIKEEVSDRDGKANTLSNLGVVYRDIGQPQEAIENWKKSVTITLEMRAGLQKQNRQSFIQDNLATPIALVDLLIDQNQPDEALKWHNLATTFELADYTRLIDAKVSDPEAQKLIDQWNQNNQRLQYLYAQIDDNWTPQLSEQITQLEAETNPLADDIIDQYPEAAELFETTPQDIETLKANIAPGTLVIQPALLTNVSNVPDTIALFIVTRDQATLVKKIPINPTEFDNIITEYRAQLQNRNSDDYDRNQEQLYDYLIRPIEAEITAYSPEQLAIIATGKLRYIPFETLYDNQTDQYLIEKYPIHYLTRISANRTQINPTSSPTVLAFGNPTPTKVDLAGAEQEARQVTEILSGEYWLREQATLDRLKTDAPRFSLVHLATHGCFQSQGCPGIGLDANQILFANGENLNLADVALLGLDQTNLVVLSACQTAMEAESDGREFAAVAYLFERAGANAVIASLWNASDEDTRQIMTQFYDNLNQGMTKVEALRQAKLSLGVYDQHPFFWSPLILIGDGSSF